MTRFVLLAVLLLLPACRGGWLFTAETAHASNEVIPLPGRDLTGEERAPVTQLITQLGELRQRVVSPPIVRIMPVGVLRAMNADRGVPSIGVDALGLAPPPPPLDVSWWPEDRVIASTEVAVESAAFREAIALASGPVCAPADSSSDAASAADALTWGIAQIALLEHALVSDGVSLHGAAPNPAVFADALRGAHSDTTGRARLAGAATALQLFDAGAWRTLDRTCQAPPASVSALLHPERWEMGVRPIAVAPPQVPAWEAEGFSPAGDDRLGEGALADWISGVFSLDPEMASIWRGDALRVYRRGDEVRVAWSLALASRTHRVELLSALNRRLLPDGRTLIVREGPGDIATLLLGADGDPITSVSAPTQAHSWPHSLRPVPDANQSAAGRQAAARRARFARGDGGGDVYLGDAVVQLTSGWSASPGNTPGRSVRLNRRSGLHVELFRTPSVLTGDPERAAGDLIALARENAGIQEAARKTPSRHGALSRVQGVTRLSRYEVIEVFAISVGDDVVIAEARWRGQRSDPSAWRVLKASLRAL